MSEKATFAAGCFWGIEATFRRVKGVLATTAGYSGGSFQDPTYDDVCSGKTGHAEAVQVEFDSSKISYDELLEVFWSSHNPGRSQDPGYQYRSAIFFHTPQQHAAAMASKENLEKSSGKPVTTQISPVAQLYRAEEYHQQYSAKHGRA